MTTPTTSSERDAMEEVREWLDTHRGRAWHEDTRKLACDLAHALREREGERDKACENLAAALDLQEYMKEQLEMERRLLSHTDARLAEIAKDRDPAMTSSERDAMEEEAREIVAEWRRSGSGTDALTKRITHALREWDARLAEAREAIERAYGECEWEFNQRGSWGALSNEAVEMLRIVLARLRDPEAKG